MIDKREEIAKLKREEKRRKIRRSDVDLARMIRANNELRRTSDDGSYRTRISTEKSPIRISRKDKKMTCAIPIMGEKGKKEKHVRFSDVVMYKSY